jgi:hypothetical protein
MAQLALNDADIEIRHWFLEQANSIECKTHFYQMGTSLAVRPGKHICAPPIMMGSHLDT